MSNLFLMFFCSFSFRNTSNYNNPKDISSEIGSFYLAFCNQLFSFSILIVKFIKKQMGSLFDNESVSFKNDFKSYFDDFSLQYFPTRHLNHLYHFSQYLISNGDSDFLDTNHSILKSYCFLLDTLLSFEDFFPDFSIFDSSLPDDDENYEYCLNILQCPQEYFRHAFSHIRI